MTTTTTIAERRKATKQHKLAVAEQESELFKMVIGHRSFQSDTVDASLKAIQQHLRNSLESKGKESGVGGDGADGKAAAAAAAAERQAARERQLSELERKRAGLGSGSGSGPAGKKKSKARRARERARKRKGMKF